MFAYEGNGDLMETTLAFGSSRYRRMGEMAPPLGFVKSNATREISSMQGSFTTSGAWTSVYQPPWNIRQAFTNPGRCPNVYRRPTVGPHGELLVHRYSSVMCGKI